MNERGWYLMDMMERSQSMNREALLKIMAMAFRNAGTSSLGGERG